jgi:hypothetical protein
MSYKAFFLKKQPDRGFAAPAAAAGRTARKPFIDEDNSGFNTFLIVRLIVADY